MVSLYSYEYEPHKEETDDQDEYNNFTVDEKEEHDTVKCCNRKKKRKPSIIPESFVLKETTSLGQIALYISFSSLSNTSSNN